VTERADLQAVIYGSILANEHRAVTDMINDVTDAVINWLTEIEDKEWAVQVKTYIDGPFDRYVAKGVTREEAVEWLHSYAGPRSVLPASAARLCRRRVSEYEPIKQKEEG